MAGERYFPLPNFRTETDRITTLLLAVDAIILVAVLVLAKDRLTGALSVLAASGSGALIGLLFAIPRRVTVPDVRTDRAQQQRGALLVANTSLEEVSDWLTKTIVGVGLVSWGSVLAILDRAGLEVGRAVVGDTGAALACGVAIIIASSAHAGLCAYLWFSRHLPGEFTAAYEPGRDTQGLVQKTESVAPELPTSATLSPVPPTRGDGIPAIATRLQDAVRSRYARMRQAPLDIEDWAAGMFGGSASVTNEFGARTLSASVRRVAEGTFQVVLTVEAEPVPETPCVFFLHDTFSNTTPSIGFDENGKASLTVTAWGAFTVGALTDDGTTELELNLAKIRGAPRDFRAN